MGFCRQRGADDPGEVAELGDANFAPGIEPVAVAYFKGRLAIRALPPATRLFMRVVTSLTVKEQEGEFLDRASVKDWGGALLSALS